MNQQRILLLALAAPVLAVCMQGTPTSLHAQDFELPSLSDLNAGIDLPTNPLPGGPLSSPLPKIGSSQGSSLRGEVIKALKPDENPLPPPTSQPTLSEPTVLLSVAIQMSCLMKAHLMTRSMKAKPTKARSLMTKSTKVLWNRLCIKQVP